MDSIGDDDIAAAVLIHAGSAMGRGRRLRHAYTVVGSTVDSAPHNGGLVCWRRESVARSITITGVSALLDFKLAATQERSLTDAGFSGEGICVRAMDKGGCCGCFLLRDKSTWETR